MEFLHARWTELCERQHATPELIDDWFEKICQRYQEPQREYHTLRHIDELIRSIDDNQSAIGDLDAVVFAAYFHDVVYDPHSSDNEKRSAEMAREFLDSVKINAARIERVAAFIVATEDHSRAQTDTDCRIFTDCDLLILAADSSRYVEYSRQIRQEYSFISERDFAMARCDFLRRMLGAAAIYKTPAIRVKHEERARQNILAEIERLESSAQN